MPKCTALFPTVPATEEGGATASSAAGDEPDAAGTISPVSLEN